MRISKVSFAYDTKDILRQLSFEIKTGKITTILGANGSGKSTLFSLLTKVYRPREGTIFWGGKDIQTINRKDFSKEVAIVYQQNTVEDDMSVYQLVSYGRIPHMKRFKGRQKEDEEAIEWALAVTRLTKYRDYEMGKLSGGQRQRAFIAMALAQRTKILFLDEPTTFLDIRYQIEILELIRKLNSKYHLTIVMILHDINQAICYSDEIIGLKRGEISVQGQTKAVITEEVIEELYGLKLKVGMVEAVPFVWTMRKY